MTTKERAFLKKEANHMDSVCQIGKNGLDKTQLQSIEDVLIARELIKITIHESCSLNPWEVMNILAEELKALPVQVIGRKLILYRNNPKLGKFGI